MGSPTPLSEVNLKRYKARGGGKKSGSLFSEHPQLSTKDFEDGDADEGIGPRSLSLTALATSDAPSAGETTRMAQLESLEAKMASIEVSLSNLSGGLSNGLGGMSSGPRKKKSVGSSRSLYSSSVCGGAPTGGTGKPALKEFTRELELLRQNLKDKENLIHNLQGQLRKLSKRKMVTGSITSTDSGVVSLRILTEGERKTAEERLSQLDHDMEVKRAEIRRINHLLERLDPSDNIDVRIRQAECEYELEREELSLMNLQEERRNLHTLLDDNDALQRRTEHALYASIPLNNFLSIHSFEVSYEGHDPCFTVGRYENKPGTFINWTREDLKTLKRGDRIVEINGSLVVSKAVNRLEEFWVDEGEGVSQDDDDGTPPRIPNLSDSPTNSNGSDRIDLRIVILRTPPPPPPPRVPNKELHTLKEELALVSAKLEVVNGEKRDLTSLCQNQQKTKEIDHERFRVDTEKAARERDALRAESVRLKHRISYLEEQVTELLQRKEVNGGHPQVVFQKGGHKTLVAQAEQPKKSYHFLRPSSPNRPPSVASSNRNGSESHRMALKTRLWETFRRATSGDSRSVCSVDSSSGRTLENGYFKDYKGSKKRNSESKSSRAFEAQIQHHLSRIEGPPTKPIRLSLIQRASSTCNVYSTASGSLNGDNLCPTVDLNPGLRRSNYSENTLVDHWTTGQADDLQSEPSEKKRGKGLRWPSLRPASSMSYQMGKRSSSNIAKF